MTTYTWGPGPLEKLTLNTAVTGNVLTATLRGEVPLVMETHTRYLPVDRVVTVDLRRTRHLPLGELAIGAHSGDGDDAMALAAAISADMIEAHS